MHRWPLIPGAISLSPTRSGRPFDIPTASVTTTQVQGRDTVTLGFTEDGQPAWSGQPVGIAPSVTKAETSS